MPYGIPKLYVNSLSHIPFLSQFLLQVLLSSMWGLTLYKNPLFNTGSEELQKGVGRVVQKTFRTWKPVLTTSWSRPEKLSCCWCPVKEWGPTFWQVSQVRPSPPRCHSVPLFLPDQMLFLLPALCPCPICCSPFWFLPFLLLCCQSPPQSTTHHIYRCWLCHLWYVYHSVAIPELRVLYIRA